MYMCICIYMYMEVGLIGRCGIGWVGLIQHISIQV
jgi:hypothetical protein